MPRSWRRWPIPPRGRKSKPSAKSYSRPTSRTRKLSRPTTRPSSTNGGRSSSRPVSKPATDVLFGCLFRLEGELIVRRLAFAGDHGGQAAHADHQRAEQQRSCKRFVVVPVDIGESLRARHADRHRGNGDDQANHERHGGNQFDADNATSRYSFCGNGGRKTDLPGQLSHDLNPSRISSLRCRKVARDFGEAIEK